MVKFQVYKNRLHCILVSVLLIGAIPLVSLAQSIDSILIEANEITNDTLYIKFMHDNIWSLRHEDRKLAFSLLNHMEEWYENHEVDYRKDSNIYYFGLLHKYDGEYSKSANQFRKYLDFQIKKKDSTRIGAVYNALSNLYFDQSVFDTSMYYTTLALDIYDKVNDTSTYVNMLTRKGMILLEVDRFDEALQHQKEAVSLGFDVAPPNIFANVLNNTALVYEAMNVPDSTIYYYKEYKDYALKHNLDRAVYYAEYNLANYLIKQGDNNESMDLLQSAYKGASKYDDPNMLNFIVIGLANLYNKKGKPDKAIAQINFVDLSTSTIEHKKSLHEQSYLAYKKMGNMTEALTQHEKYKEYADSMLNESVSMQLQDIEAKYETEKKEGKIQNLQLIQATDKKRLLYQRGLIALFIAGLGVLGFFLFLLKKKNGLIANNNRIIQHNLDQKNLLLQEIHHRVKNNLQVISSLLRLQSRSSSGNAATALTSSESRVRSMALIHQHLYQGDDIASVHMFTYLGELVHEVLNSHIAIKDNVDLTLNISKEIYLDVKSVVPIGLITNEWLTNICKYAFPESTNGQIKLTFDKLNSNNYLLEISDNGVGYDISDDQNSGFGTRLVKAFANRIGGELSISNKNGTICRLQFPITNKA